jgi:hypothetical protein
MTRGILLFAFNNGKTDYFEMAARTAKRANKFLNLPVTVVTDSNTDLSKYEDVFDSIIINESDTTNIKDNQVWINKGRHKAYDLSPYDETLVLDTDYLINSSALLKPFELYDDFMCHNSTNYLLVPNQIEKVSQTFIETAWATVIYFKKTSRTKQIFECMEMIQNNYQHYVCLFNIISTMYRNDYSLTIALWIVNGHTTSKQDYIPWNLLHLNNHVTTHRINETEYLCIKNNKYITVKDIDFHILNKNTFMELTNE